MKETIPVLLILIGVALSGCIEPEPKPQTETDGNNFTESLSSFLMDGCLYANTYLEDPNSRLDPNLPPGWRYNTFAVPLVGYDIWICDRVSTGPYERSDVALLFETNYGPDAPNSCMDFTKTRGVDLVKGIWISDLDLSRYLSDEMNYTVRTFTLDVEDGRSELPSRMQISWQIAGVVRGDLEFHGTQSGSEERSKSQMAYVWSTPNQGIGLWAMHTDSVTHQVGPKVASGTISSPHWNPNPTSDAWLGRASARTSDTTSEFFQFEDFLCEEPL